MKNKKTLNQLEYEKALKNLKRRIKAAEKRGFRFDKSEILPSEKPKRITKKRIESIKKLNIYYQKGATYLNDDTGKVVSGIVGRAIERKARAKKAAQTRKARKEQKQQKFPKPVVTKYTPTYSAIASVENKLDEIINAENWQYLHKRITGGENSAIKLKEIFQRTKQSYANANALNDFEKYLEKNAEAINNALDVVMYASKQEELQDYNGSYSKLAMIFNGGEIPSQQDMTRSD